MQRKVIYSMRVMLALVERGHMPEAVMPNPQNTKYNCWVFVETDELKADLDSILGARSEVAANG